MIEHKCNVKILHTQLIKDFTISDLTAKYVKPFSSEATDGKAMTVISNMAEDKSNSNLHGKLKGEKNGHTVVHTLITRDDTQIKTSS